MGQPAVEFLEFGLGHVMLLFVQGLLNMTNVRRRLLFCNVIV
jgi:hypothetical protein